MKKNPPLLLLFVVVGLVFSCLSDPDERRVRRFSVSDAREFFEDNAETFSSLSILSPSASTRAGELPADVLTPVWSTAATYVTDSMDIVNVPVKANFNMMVRRYDNAPGAPMDHFNTSVDNQLIIAKKRSGTIDMFVANMLPDYDYLTRHSKRNAKYLHPENNFSGFIIFSELNGALREVWRYDNGLPLQKVTIIPLSQDEVVNYKGVRIQAMIAVTKNQRTRSFDSEGRRTDYGINENGTNYWYGIEYTEPFDGPRNSGIWSRDVMATSLLEDFRNTVGGDVLYNAIHNSLLCGNELLDIYYFDSRPPGHENYDGIHGITYDDNHVVLMWKKR